MEKIDWKNFNKGVFIVNVLAIIYNKKDKTILIGKRKKDPYIKKLSWTFPGGRPAYKEDLENYLEHEVKIKTGIKIKINKIIFAKTYPENRKFLSIYYLCQNISGLEKGGEKFTELKWVKISQIKKYFTTSIHPTLLKYLKNLK